jgi:uncharacterized membrane protein YsdA (DUF1294 family)
LSFIEVSAFHQLLFGWLALTSFIAFVLFGYDKYRAGQTGQGRVSEFALVLVGAVGGWPGGLVGMLVFCHKTAKLSFQLKYGVAFLVWAGLIYGAISLR